jgi:hypothetical protein
MAMVDDHIAWTAQTERPTSKGTMIVDWDGTGEPVITYRKKKPEEVPAAVQAPASVPLRAAPQARIPSETLPQTQALPSSRMPVQSRQDPSAYKRKPLSAVPSVADSMRELRQPQRKPAAPPSHTRYDSMVSQARGPILSKPLPPPSQSSSQAPPAPRQSAHPAQNPNKYNTADGFIATYRPPRFSISLNTPKPGYVRGYDASCEYEYDYDRKIVHVHRSPPSKRSGHSDYYAVDVNDYHPDAELVVVVPETASGEVKRKHGNVIRFVEKMLRRLDGFGIMWKLKAERKASKKAEGWKGEGYYT